MRMIDEKIDYICLNCGDKFKGSIGGHPKFCSIKCGYYYRKNTGISIRGYQNKRECELCGKVFYANNSDKKKFCSRKCSNVGKVPSINNMNRNLVETTCKGCGKQFHKEFYKLAKYCNRECWNNTQKRKWKKLTCKVCKKKFMVRLSRLPQYFCSNKCRENRGHSIKMVTIRCKNCNKSFTLPHYKFKSYKLKNEKIKQGRKYCSKKCGYERKNANSKN